MDKLKPSHDLEAFKVAFARHKSATLTAVESARTLGFEKREELVQVTNALERKHFIKSVTAFNNHRQWQDVYVISWNDIPIYLKFTDHVLTEFILLSFKRK